LHYYFAVAARKSSSSRKRGWRRIAEITHKVSPHEITSKVIADDDEFSKIILSVFKKV
jgi:hypothetical protein